MKMINLHFNVCFGLGLFVSRDLLLSDDCKTEAVFWNYKLALGPILANGLIRVSKWKPATL